MNPKLAWSLALIALEWWLDRERRTPPPAPPAAPPAEGAEPPAVATLRVRLLHDPRSLRAVTWPDVQDRYNRSLEASARGDYPAAERILRGPE